MAIRVHYGAGPALASLQYQGNLGQLMEQRAEREERLRLAYDQMAQQRGLTAFNAANQYRQLGMRNAMSERAAARNMAFTAGRDELAHRRGLERMEAGEEFALARMDKGLELDREKATHADELIRGRIALSGDKDIERDGLREAMRIEALEEQRAYAEQLKEQEEAGARSEALRSRGDLPKHLDLKRQELQNSRESIEKQYDQANLHAAASAALGPAMPGGAGAAMGQISPTAQKQYDQAMAQWEVEWQRLADRAAMEQPKPPSAMERFLSGQKTLIDENGVPTDDPEKAAGHATQNSQYTSPKYQREAEQDERRAKTRSEIMSYADKMMKESKGGGDGLGVTKPGMSFKQALRESVQRHLDAGLDVPEDLAKLVQDVEPYSEPPAWYDKTGYFEPPAAEAPPAEDVAPEPAPEPEPTGGGLGGTVAPPAASPPPTSKPAPKPKRPVNVESEKKQIEQEEKNRALNSHPSVLARAMAIHAKDQFKERLGAGDAASEMLKWYNPDAVGMDHLETADEIEKLDFNLRNFLEKAVGGRLPDQIDTFEFYEHIKNDLDQESRAEVDKKMETLRGLQEELRGSAGKMTQERLAELTKVGGEANPRGLTQADISEGSLKRGEWYMFVNDGVSKIGKWTGKGMQSVRPMRAYDKEIPVLLPGGDKAQLEWLKKHDPEAYAAAEKIGATMANVSGGPDGGIFGIGRVQDHLSPLRNN